MKTYIKPIVKCIDIDAQDIMLVLSNGTEADSNYEGGGDARLRRGRNVVDDIFYDDFDEE